MPDQTPIERTSLTTTLEQRYANQHVGGAFDATSVLIEGYSSLTLGGNPSLLSATYTPAGFKLQQPPMQTEFKESSLNTAAKSGHSSQKYKP